MTATRLRPSGSDARYYSWNGYRARAIRYRVMAALRREPAGTAGRPPILEDFSHIVASSIALAHRLGNPTG